MKSHIQSLEVSWNKLIQNSILFHAVMSSQNNANVHQLLCNCTSSLHVAGRIDVVRYKTALVFDTKVNSVSIQLTDNVAVWTLLGNGRSNFFHHKNIFHTKSWRHLCTTTVLTSRYNDQNVYQYLRSSARWRILIYTYLIKSNRFYSVFLIVNRYPSNLFF